MCHASLSSWDLYIGPACIIYIIPCIHDEGEFYSISARVIQFHCPKVLQPVNVLTPSCNPLVIYIQLTKSQKIGLDTMCGNTELNCSTLNCCIMHSK